MKSNYLNNLEREFYFVDSLEREQIIAEYAVHFEERIKDGATENEVISNLGTPKTVAIEYATELGINYSSFDKTMYNFKRDTNMYVANLKKKINSVKNEQNAKRNNIKNYVEGENDGQGNNNPTLDSDTVINNRNLSMNKHLRRIINLIVGVFYLLKNAIVFIWRIFITCFLFVCSVQFGLMAISGVVVAIFLPMFLSFTNNTLLIWFLIYGGIFSLVALFVTLCLACLKRFGVGTHE
ncbi:DUF1700 domain-containing protein [Mollicutes bacterium LVI A0039]|nr:DUF1700 domain-containing protein [Mollicutes bacterium LVI A0039]